MTNSTGTSRPVAVAELQRAWTAVRAGDFRRTGDRTVAVRSRPAEPDVDQDIDREMRQGPQGLGNLAAPSRTYSTGSAWSPAAGELVLPVVGAAGSVGASTVALALATAATHLERSSTATVTARVVECCSATSSGLAAASTAELGRTESGWVRGTREGVVVERAGEVLISATQVPTPAPLGTDQTDEVDMVTAWSVLDTGWETGQLMAGGSWLSGAVGSASVVVVVARPTIPGFRRLEATLDLLEVDGVVSTHLAVLGPRRKRWAKGVEYSAGPRTRAAMSEGRMTEVPEDRFLAVTGLGSAPLPLALLTAAGHLLSRIEAHPAHPNRGPHIDAQADPGPTTEGTTS